MFAVSSFSVSTGPFTATSAFSSSTGACLYYTSIFTSTISSSFGVSFTLFFFNNHSFHILLTFIISTCSVSTCYCFFFLYLFNYSDARTENSNEIHSHCMQIINYVICSLCEYLLMIIPQFLYRYYLIGPK